MGRYQRRRRTRSGPGGPIAYLGSSFRPCGINTLALVTLTFASWNQIAGWLGRLAALRTLREAA